MKLSNAKIGMKVVFKDKYISGEKEPFFRSSGEKCNTDTPQDINSIFVIDHIDLDGDFTTTQINGMTYSQSVNHKCFKKYKG